MKKVCIKILLLVSAVILYFILSTIPIVILYLLDFIGPEIFPIKETARSGMFSFLYIIYLFFLFAGLIYIIGEAAAALEPMYND